MAYGNHPILAKDRLDYTDGSYETSVKNTASGTSLEIRHAVSGRNLVASLLKKSQAAFAVEVSSPYATYRQVRRMDAVGETELTQVVSWQAEEVVPPVYVRPLVIATKERSTTIKLNGNHGVHAVWQGTAVDVVPGAILAQDRFWRGSSTWESLIRLVSDEALPAGAYRVETNTGEGFHFRVHMHPEMFARMVNPGDAQHQCASILTGCLSRGLELVRMQYGEGDAWQEFPVLRALHSKLIENELETWDNNHDFRADEVASRLKPITFRVHNDE